MRLVHAMEGISSPRYHYLGCVSWKRSYATIDGLIALNQTRCPAKLCYEKTSQDEENKLRERLDPWFGEKPTKDEREEAAKYLADPNSVPPVMEDDVIAKGQYPPRLTHEELQAIPEGMAYFHVRKILPIALYKVLMRLPFERRWKFAQVIRKDLVAIKPHLALAMGVRHDDVGPEGPAQLSREEFPEADAFSEILENLVSMLCGGRKGVIGKIKLEFKGRWYFTGYMFENMFIGVYLPLQRKSCS